MEGYVAVRRMLEIILYSTSPFVSIGRKVTKKAIILKFESFRGVLKQETTRNASDDKE